MVIKLILMGKFLFKSTKTPLIQYLLTLFSELIVDYEQMFEQQDVAVNWNFGSFKKGRCWLYFEATFVF